MPRQKKPKPKDEHQRNVAFINRANKSFEAIQAEERLAQQRQAEKRAAQLVELLDLANSAGLADEHALSWAKDRLTASGYSLGDALICLATDFEAALIRLRRTSETNLTSDSDHHDPGAADEFPSPTGWSFKPGHYAFDGIAKTISGKLAILLQLCANQRFAIPAASVITTLSSDVSEAHARDATYARGVILRLSRQLRSDWNLPDEAEPFVLADRGKNLAWRFVASDLIRVARQNAK